MSRKAQKIGGMHSSVLRRINAVRTFNALRLNPGVAQRDLVNLTGIDKSTVSTIINGFDAAGLVLRQPEDSQNKPGRPSETLSLKPEAGLMIGIHVEPERLLMVASGLDGKPTATSLHPAIRGVEQFGGAVEAALDAFLDKIGRSRPDVRSIGMCVPGLITTGGWIAESSNMRWRDLDVADALSRRLGQLVWLGNDSRGAGLAEKLFGRCIEVDDYIFLDSASGVGGALFLEGAIYTGVGGFAGELGHCKVVPHGRLCDCGASGCLSAYVSEPALKRRFATLDMPAASFEDMRKAAADCAPAALSALDEAGEMLGLALSDFINLFNPPIIVLGGGLAVLAGYLMPAAERALRRGALASSLELCKIVVSSLALDAIPQGALALALDGLTRLPGEGTFPW